MVMRVLALAALVAAAGCGKPDANPPAGASVAFKGVRLAVEWLRSDPDRRYPIGRRGALGENDAVLCGWTRDRILHFFSESYAAFDVAFLSADGAVTELQALPSLGEAGITSKSPARYALFLREGWLARHGAAAGDRAAFSPEIALAPAEPMPEVKVGGVPVPVETAHRYEQRTRGLMYRRAMSPDEGLLFLYKTASSRSFWMGHCYFGLDIAYFGDDRALINVVSIDPYPDPENDVEPKAPSDAPARFVLEMHKGWFRSKGLADERGKPARAIRLELPASVENLLEKAD